MDRCHTRIGYQQNHTLTVSGGNSKSNYRASIDYRDARGVDLRSTRQEYGIRLGGNHTTKSGLFTFSANCSPRAIRKDNAVGFGAMKNNPTAPVYDETQANGFYHFPAGGSGTNNVEQAAEILSQSEVFVLEWNASAQINLLPLLAPQIEGMTLTSRVMYADHPVNKFNGSYTNSTYSGQMNSGITGSGSRDYDQIWRNNFEWVTNFGYRKNGHNVRVMGGYSYSYGTSAGLAASNSNFSSDATTYNDIGSGLKAAESGVVNISTYKSDNKLIAFFGRVNYDWKERYLLTLSIRREGSSKFGENHKWGNFPAASVGWRLSDEPFMAGASEWLDDLKFRYDFGVTGNQDFDNYLSLSTFRSYGWYEYEGQKFKVWGPSSNVNSELRWEKGYNQNVGVDFSFLKYRISGSFNYYYRRQVDLLGSYNVPVPPNLFSTIYANVGTMHNDGFEFDLKFIPIRKDNLEWSITLLGATNNNIFESFSNDVYQGKSYYSTCEMDNPNNPGYLQRIEEGQRIGNYYTYRYAGVDKAGNWLIYDAHDNIIPIGEGTDEDKTITGNGLPWFTGSLSTSLDWGRFDASLSLRFATGFQIFNVHDFYYGLQNMTTNVLCSAYSRNAHITTGTNAITDYFLEPGDYLKLDNVSFGYTQPFKSKYIQKLRLFFNASNLYTLTKFTGIDPSSYQVNGLTPGTFGGSAYYYPAIFQFVFGIQIGF